MLRCYLSLPLPVRGEREEYIFNIVRREKEDASTVRRPEDRLRNSQLLPPNPMKRA